jgi:prephenate dehydrogenase
MGLRDKGWVVSGSDSDERVVATAIKRDVIVGSNFDDAAQVFVSVPAQEVVSVARSLLPWLPGTAVVTDVAGVKSSIVSEVDDPRFIGGHPMAGSELKGLDGSRPNLFHGATWVLTPGPNTAPEAFAQLHSIITELGASPLALPAETHDRLVAMASHVPHLVAGALMNEASGMAREDTALLRLAAGGFRDMTRISAGEPGIWPAVLFNNSREVRNGLNRVIQRLARLERIVALGDREALLEELSSAAIARSALPGRGMNYEQLAVILVPVDDRPGVLASITQMASSLNINIFDIGIAHSVEGSLGVLQISVEKSECELLLSELHKSGFTGSTEA